MKIIRGLALFISVTLLLCLLGDFLSPTHNGSSSGDMLEGIFLDSIAWTAFVSLGWAKGVKL